MAGLSRKSRTGPPTRNKDFFGIVTLDEVSLVSSMLPLSRNAWTIGTMFFGGTNPLGRFMYSFLQSLLDLPSSFCSKKFLNERIIHLPIILERFCFC